MPISLIPVPRCPARQPDVATGPVLYLDVPVRFQPDGADVRAGIATRAAPCQGKVRQLPTRHRRAPTCEQADVNLAPAGHIERRGAATGRRIRRCTRHATIIGVSAPIQKRAEEEGWIPMPRHIQKATNADRINRAGCNEAETK